MSSPLLLLTTLFAISWLGYAGSGRAVSHSDRKLKGSNDMIATAIMSFWRPCQ